MPRSSFQSLLITSALVAGGIATVIATFCGLAEFLGGADAHTAAILLWFVSGALIGAGLLLPWNRPWLGALISLPIQALLGTIYWFLAFALRF